MKQIYMSLGRRSGLWCGAVLAIVLGLITALNNFSQEDILRRQGLKEGQVLSNAILSGIRYSMLNGGQDSIQLQLFEYRDFPGIKSINLIDSAGVIRRSTAEESLGQQETNELVAKALQGDNVFSVGRLWKAKEKVFTQATPIFNKPECRTCHGSVSPVLGVLRVSLDWEPVDRAIREAMVRSIVIALAGLLGMGILTGTFLAKQIVRPIEELEKGMRKVAAGDFDQRVVYSGRDEIGKVMLMFNTMTQDLKRHLEKEKALIAVEQKQRQALEQSLSQLSATLESIEEGIFIVDGEGNVVNYNQKFLSMWNIPSGIIEMLSDKKLIEAVVAQLKNPNKFLKDIALFYDNPEQGYHDAIESIDGKVFECDTPPQWGGGRAIGWVWSFRDITAQHRMQQELTRKIETLERFNKFVVGRELYMRELKDRVEELEDTLKYAQQRAVDPNEHKEDTP